MSINEVNFRNIRFTRDTKVDYQKGNPVINTVFAEFDKDHNGVFSDEEYEEYEQYLKVKDKRRQEIDEIKINDSVVNHYDKKILKIDQKIENLYLKMKDEKIDAKAFQKLLDFEAAHPEVQRVGYSDKKEMPKNAVEYDISAFGMGIYDKEKDVFTGECYKKGYITGLETLSEEERKEYMTLLDNASNACDRLNKFHEQISKYEDELDKYFGLKDMAQNGMLNAVGTEEAENQAYEQYVQIRNDANPFYKQIQELEAKYNQLLLKGTKTDEDNRLLEQYRIQIRQLEAASRTWSLSDMSEKAQIQLDQGQGFNIENISEQAVSSSASESLSNTHSLGMRWQNINWNVSANFSETDRCKSDGNTEHSFNVDQSVRYARERLSLSETSSLNIEPNSLYFNQRLGAQYGRYGLNVSEEVRRMSSEMPDENGNIQKQTQTSSSTSIDASIKTGKFDNTASVQFAPEGTSYRLGTSTNYEIKADKVFANDNVSIDFSPSTNITYNEKTHSTTLNPSLNVMAMYNNGNFSGNINIIEDYSTTMLNGQKPYVNNNFSVNTSVSLKQWSVGFKFNDSDNSYSHSNTYGAEVSYNTPKAGRVSFGYSHQKTHNKMQGMNTSDNTVQFSYTMPLDTINNLFKKK